MATVGCRAVSQKGIYVPRVPSHMPWVYAPMKGMSQCVWNYMLQLVACSLNCLQGVSKTPCFSVLFTVSVTVICY